MIRRVLLIANPASRRGRPRADVAINEFARRSVACDLVFTERAGHAAELARAASPEYDAVFSLGGDGTAMEVAGALARSGRRVGVLPGGTGNLLARALGISLDTRHAVRDLLDGDELDIDLGRLEDGRCFAVAAGIGIDASMVADTPVHLKKRLGVLAYVIIATRAALRSVVARQYIRARVTVDGEQLLVEEAAAVMIANFGAMLGGRITLGHGIRADDGVLDVCIFAPRSVLDAFLIARRLLVRDFSSTPSMIYRAGRVIRIEADPPVPAQADGELIGSTPFSVFVEPLAVRLLVPRRGDDS